jgi:hypothetical protein
MPTQRRYVVRLYEKGRYLAGILEDARTGAENPFNGARELVSLLRTPPVPSSASLQPRGELHNAEILEGKRQSKRRIRKERKA